MSRPTPPTLAALAVAGALALAACLVAMMASQKAASAAFPGENGRIAFESSRWLGPLHGYAAPENRTVTPVGTEASTLTDWGTSPAYSPDGTRIAFVCIGPDAGDVCIMNADGSGITNVTNTPTGDEGDPAWSPDGTQIVFARRGDLYVADVDGTDERQLTDGTVENRRGGDHDPSWSPDGSKIVFWRYEITNELYGHRFDLFVVNADGTGERRLLPKPPPDTCTRAAPDWSPDGTKVLFVDGCGIGGRSGGLYVASADGATRERLTTTTRVLGWPTWSPDGTKIAFISQAGDYYDVFVMDADGTNPVNITNTPEVDESHPSWQPLSQPTTPQTKAECKRGGYEEFGFKNQGRCIAFVNRAAHGQ